MLAQVGIGNAIQIPRSGQDSYKDIREPSVKVPTGGFDIELRNFGYVDPLDKKYKSYYQPIISDGVKNVSLWWGRAARSGGVASNIETDATYPYDLYFGRWQFVRKNQTISFTHTIKGPVRERHVTYIVGEKDHVWLRNTGDIFVQDKTKYKIKFVFPK